MTAARASAWSSLGAIGVEIRVARTARALSIAACSRAAGISISEWSRIERGRAPRVPAIVLFRCAAIVGLDLSLRAFPGAPALRDGSQVPLLVDFHDLLHASLRWGTEVPLPGVGDLRAWDGLVAGTGWRYGVEAETLPNDAQALVRRLALKQRDGEVDGVLLLLRGTRRVSAFLRAAGDVLAPFFPVPGRDALARLRVGADPRGSAVILVPRRPTSKTRPVGR